MTTFEIVEGRPWHCGAIARTLRREHAAILLQCGADAHAELRACFDQSAFRRAWMIDGRLAALGGVTGTLASSSGMIWLAVSEAATRYPHEMVAEARRQLRALMRSRRNLFTSALVADDAAARFALFLGFVAHGGDAGPALSRHGRRLALGQLEGLSVLADGARVVPFVYTEEAA